MATEEERRDLHFEILEEVDARHRKISLTQRLECREGAMLAFHTVYAERFMAKLLCVGADWVAVGLPANMIHVLPVASITAVEGVGAKSRVETRTLIAALGYCDAVGAIADFGDVVQIDTTMSVIRGVIVRVGRDHIDLRPLRHENEWNEGPGEVMTLALSAVRAVIGDGIDPYGRTI